MGKILSLSNQKGGTSKSSSAVNLGTIKKFCVLTIKYNYSLSTSVQIVFVFIQASYKLFACKR